MTIAQEGLRELTRLTPDLTQERLSATWFFRDPAVPQRLLAAYQACGLPER
jgi:hypothetical protein